MTRPTVTVTRPKSARKARAPLADRVRPGRNVAESPLSWLFNRRDRNGNPLIGEAEFNAGERLRADFWFAQMTPNVTQSWSVTATTGGSGRRGPHAAEQADNVIVAAERVRRALDAVGPELAGILIDVCGHLKGLEEIERRARWPQRSAKLVLGIALSALARHYGLIGEAQAAPRTARVRHWGANDYRPAIDAG